jgi:hypothetical protein
MATCGTGKTCRLHKPNEAHQGDSPFRKLSAQRSLDFKKAGRLPITIRGPIQVQCTDNGDHRRLRGIVEKVMAWPHVEAHPLPIGSKNFLSLQLAGDALISRYFFA